MGKQRISYFMKIRYSWGQIVGSNIVFLHHAGVKWGQGVGNPIFMGSNRADLLQQQIIR